MSGPETTTFEGLEQEFKKRSDKALAMGGPAKLAARHAAGLLNARERIDHLADPDSFTEFGLFAQSAREADRDRTPGDGKISGLIRIGGRSAAVVSNDFTVMGASSATTNGDPPRPADSLFGGVHRSADAGRHGGAWHRRR